MSSAAVVIDALRVNGTENVPWLEEELDKRGFI